MRVVDECFDSVRLFELEPHTDSRGSFVRIFDDRVIAAEGLDPSVAHANVSTTRRRATIRGLHYQVPPSAEAKTIHCLAGSIFDVLVDVRPGSPTYLQWKGFELDDGLVLHIPAGFAHGFQTLASDTVVHYMMSKPYDRERERGIRWDDPAVAVDWPHAPTELSAKDAAQPAIGEAWHSGF